MALNVKSLYNNNSSGANTTTKKSGLNVQSLRDREFELKVSENKSIGNISYGAKQAIESNTLDSYTPKNDAEKSVLDTYKKWTGYGKTYDTVKAQYDKNKFGKGNIDLTNRPIFKNSNGAISTVDSIGISEDGKEIVIPTIIKDKNGNAKRLTEDEAIKHYHETGEYLGKFNTRDEADEYAQTLHIDQDLYYSALPEMTTEEELTLSKYGFNPTSFSNDDFKVWAEAHNFEYRMAGNDLTGTEYKWLPNNIVDEVENDDTVSGKKGKHYYVSKHTPEIIVKKADIEDLPMIISFETLYLAVRENGELKGHYHSLGASNTKKLYKVLSDPTYILKNNENGRINIISDIAIGKNNKSVISIELDVYKNVEGVKDTKHKGNYNLVITLFSAKDNYAENLKNKQEMSVLYEKKEDTHSSDLTSENMMLGNTENVSSDTIIAEEAENVNTSEETTIPTLTDKCELHETTHTKTGEALWVISLNDKITSDEYKALSAAVKKVGGYYSRFAKTPDGKAIPGFIFKSKPNTDVINTFNSFFGTETAEETAPTETKSTVKEIDTEALLGAVENAKVGDEVKLSDYEKTEADEQGLNNEPESDTMVSETTKEDFKVGDIIDVNGKQWRVTSTDFTMTFENLDKNDSEATFQHIGGMDSFKNTHEYTVIKESAENVHDGILGRESRNDNAVREPEPVSETEEKRHIRTEDRELGKDVAPENGKHIQSSETETSATGQHDSRDSNNRVRESDDSDGNSGTGIDGNNNVDVTENSSKSKDFVITKTVAEDIDKSAPSMADNIKAIETLHAIEKSGKAPTKTQQGLLAKFKGWGGLAGSFFGSNRTKLQELMSESELKAAQSTVNDAYFTPTGIIDGIYKALSHLGFEGGNILEPSMGIGNFFGRMPKAVKDKSSLFGVEIDSISGRIAQQLYPSANIEIAPFQDVAYKDGAFDLIIGNVPFGEVKYSYKGKRYLIHDYFFVKAMDKLNDGGILMFLTTKGTLDKLDSTTRTELSNHGKLLGAYRLPSDVFTKSAGASVVTDLIIMQKTSDTNGESFINLGIRLYTIL